MLLAWATTGLSLVPCASQARIETLRWSTEEAPEVTVDRFLIYYGGHSGRYTSVVDVGVPPRDGDGTYQHDLEVPDEAVIYAAIASRTALGEQSGLSNEIVRLPARGTVIESATFGGYGDVPISGDWDGDGVSDLGVLSFDSPDIVVTLMLADGSLVTEAVIQGSQPYIYPVIGDWFGEGRDHLGFIDIADGNLEWLLAGGGSDGESTRLTHGSVGNIPFLAHDLGSPDLPVVVWRVGNSLVFWFAGAVGGQGAWSVLHDEESSHALPLVGDWFGGGVETAGYAKASDGEWRFHYSDSRWFFDSPPVSVSFGDPQFDTPITGDWDGDGVTEHGVARVVGADLVFLLDHSPYRCANGHVEPGEWCDDGNAVDGDGCSSRCRLEQADESADRDSDGIPDYRDGCPWMADPAPVDEDEDGIEDGCDFQVCGNGLLEPGETCDDGNVEGADGCTNRCAIESCGNGVLERFLGEQCDDGNWLDGDGCAANCFIEICEVALAGDANGDGCIDGADYTVWAEHYGKSMLGPAHGDFDCSGEVDAMDYLIWTEQMSLDLGCDFGNPGNAD